MSSIKDLESIATMINTDLIAIQRKIHAPQPNLEIDEKSINKTKEILTESKKKQKAYIKYYENDKKRYKVLKKYGEVLKLVEKLLNLMPGNLDNLSIQELEEKLKELLQTRKKNEMQIHFVFFQNLVTDLLSNLITTEKNYQEGTISSAEALANIQKSKQQIKEHAKDFPPVLQPTVEEASYLVKLYEKSYSAEETQKTATSPTPLKETKLNPHHERLFNNLNNETNSLISRIGNLSNNLSNFQPHVDVTQLTEKMKYADFVLTNESWDIDKLDETIGDLKSTTLSLTDKQVDLNNKNSKLETEIKECTTTASNLSKSAIKDCSSQTFEDITKRAQEDREITKEIAQILEEDNNLSTTIGEQVANTIIAQAEADETFTNEVAINPDAETTLAPTKEISETIDEAYNLKDQTLSLEEKRELLLKLERNKEEEDKKE